MASNNRKAPPRWPPKNAEDRSRHATARASQSGSSLHAKRRIDNKKVQETLEEMFMNVFDTEIIRSVAHSCGWKLNKSIEALVMLAEGSEFPDMNLVDNFKQCSSIQSQSVVSDETCSSMSNCGYERRKIDQNLEKESWKCVFPASIKSAKSKNKSVVMNASQGTIKVTYKGDDADLSDDDDADVVIEEENEFEVNELDLAFGDIPTQSMYQFVSPFVLTDQTHNESMTRSLTCATKEHIPRHALNKFPRKENVVSNLSSSVIAKSVKTQIKKTKHWPKLERIKKQINEGIKVMVLMRGCSGSGKTSLARHIIKSTYGENECKYIFSTDHYFVYVGNGKYSFDPRLLPSAHQWNQKRVSEEVKNETNPVIIDNTNLEAWEMEPYAKLAVKFGYNIEFLEPRTSWKNNSFELERKNIHGVPRRKIDDMLIRFERDLTPAKLLSLFNLKYACDNSPPQYISKQTSIDPLLSGTKKKLRSRKKSEGNSCKNNEKFLPNNGFAKPIQFSGILGSDVADQEIKESLDLLVSEWNRSVISASTEENSNDALEVDCIQNFHSGIVEEVSATSNVANKENYPDESSETVSKSTEIPIAQGIDIFESLGEEVGEDDEMDFLSESSENFEDLEMSGATDKWENENDEEGFQCNDAGEFNLCVGTSDVKYEDEMKHNKCLEYVLVLDDGTLLPQKSYDKNDSSSNISKEGGRVWEYLLMTDNDSNLLFHSSPSNTAQSFTTNSSLKPICSDLAHASSNLISPDELSDTNKDIMTTGNIFLQKIASEEPPLECILFPDLNTEEVTCSVGISKSMENENVKIAEEGNYEGLDLLVAEGAASLNIVFAGADDSVLTCSPVTQKPDAEKDVKDIHMLNSVINDYNSMMSVSVMPLQTSVEEDMLQITLPKQEKQTCLDDKQTQFFISDSCDKSPECIKENVLLINTCNSEVESPKALSLTHKSADNEAERNAIPDSFSFITSEEKHSATQMSTKLNSEDSLSILDTSRNSVDEKGILEEWAEGTSWDELEQLTSASVKPQYVSSTPKPARNFKRQITAECSPAKINIEEKRIDVQDSVSENWVAVEEPMTSWEMNNELLDKFEKFLGVDPQPQRKIFSETCVSINGDAKGKIADIPGTHCLMSVNDLSIPLGSADVEDQVKTFDHNEDDTVKSKLELPVSVTNDFLDTSDGSPTNATWESQKCVNHSSTNTHHTDFILLGNVNMGSEFDAPGVKVLSAHSRNILENDISSGNKQNIRKIRQILMLDKSSMTYEIISCVPEPENAKKQLEELVNIFPHCRIEDLQEIFEKCNRDINWTVDLLLESACQGIGISTSNSVIGVEPETGILVDVNSSANTNNDLTDIASSNIEGSNNAGLTVDSLSVPSSSNHSAPSNIEMSMKSPLSMKRNGKKDRILVSEMSLLLKKQLEENIVISDEHYSEHVSRLRKIRHGEINDTSEASSSTQGVNEELNEVVECQNPLDVSSKELTLEEQSCLSDTTVLRPVAPEWELSKTELNDALNEEEETVVLKMDSGFAEQLHNVFGTASLPFNQDMMRMLNLPLSLTRQLHYYMMEAEQNTYDLTMQEDEDLARKLQLQEDRVSAEAIVSTANQVPDLREIMDMEMALALYKDDQKQNSAETKEDLATKLTKNLLCEWFPSLPKDVLVDVFEAHNHSFEATLEVLLASTEEDNSVRTVMTPEARVAHEKALLMKANLEGAKNKENIQPISVENEEVTPEQALQDANHYRSEANRHYNLRNECQNKAQKAYQRGLTAAASYYSQMASLHKERIEENNARAASSLLLAHSLGNLSTTLDLHFLYVVEALQVLDMFLDHHIHQLLESSLRSVPVFVITGRGARSSGGRSRIKPAVVQRLEQRGLRYEEVNPGLLKVVITRSASSSSRMSS